MPIHKTLAGWLSTLCLAFVLILAPLRQVLAYAPQWRPFVPVQAANVPQVYSARINRFRPLEQRPARTHHWVQRAPAFAQQYAWRPAPSSWMPQKQPKSLASAPRHYTFPGRPKLVSSNRAVQNRWRPVEVAAVTVGKRVVVSQPVAYSGTAWRPLAQPNSAQPAATGSAQVIAQQAPANPAQGYYQAPYPNPATTAYMPHMPQPAWAFPPMPWMPMYQSGYNMMQPNSAIYTQSVPYTMPVSYMPVPLNPYFGHSAAMMRPRWDNAHSVWSNRRSNPQPQPGLKPGRGTLANLPPEPLCFGCDS